VDHDLLDFLRGSVRSVWGLELLLFLRRHSDRVWSTPALVQELRSSETVVREAVTGFEQAGLLRCEKGGCAYAPASQVVADLCDRVEAAYRHRPVSVINAIASARRDSLQTFADAFRLKDDPS
jgi:hypothetical protein